MKTDTGTMEDGNCEELQNYVCEKPARSKYRSCQSVFESLC